MMAGHFRRAFVSTRTTAGEAIEPGLPRGWCDRTPGHRRTWSASRRVSSRQWPVTQAPPAPRHHSKGTVSSLV